MSLTDDMWELIPAVYRRRDDESGGVLRALVAVLGEQAGVIHDDIARLYDNWFIETCDDWVAPYIGELIGARATAPRGEPASAADRERLAKVAPSRMLVANTLRWRRRKGAFSLLGQLAWDVARWPSQAVEFGARLAANRDIRFPSGAGGTAELRDPAPLALIGGPADPTLRFADVRQADAARSPGRYGPANVGVFVFRQSVVQVAHVDAASIDDEGSGRFTFDPLGREIPLYHPSPSDAEDGAKGLPGPITRALLANRRADDDPSGPGWTVDPALYGHAGCTMIWEQREEGEAFRPVEAARIMPANLNRWRDRPAETFVAIDPELGRIAFPPREAPRRLRVAYAYTAPGDVGAPSMDRPDDEVPFDKVHEIAATREEAHHDLRAALEAWRKDTAASSLIEFQDSATYDEDRLLIDFSRTARRLVIRAARGCRPIIRLADREGGAMDAWRIRGGHDGVAGPPGSSLTLEGLTVADRGLLLEAFGGELKLRNCTLIPGWSTQDSGSRRQHEAASLTFENCSGAVTIVRSITGPLFVRANELIEAPLPVDIVDSILDAGEGHAAVLAPDTIPYTDLTVRRSTIIGFTTTHAITLAENAIFTDRVVAARRQRGCVRFCFAPPGSRMPRRFACLPGPEDDPALSPVFVSRQFGAPGYGQLADSSDGKFQRSADDQGELGAYHDLFWTVRDANLREVLAEYMPAGVSAGVIYLT